VVMVSTHHDGGHLDLFQFRQPLGIEDRFHFIFPVTPFCSMIQKSTFDT
jgi:hypothetical protein